ncbi:putative DAZ-associated protein 1, RNA recognition motif 2 [Rosa chinensis]|uniref:Putative DAZ-associated protein 1, RNA recognition motif 2 n=1 Tax=Rosa chinensis TaxID=74649 RepID=A0A2P6QRA7_ROSCH|nr:heterogeneous nuclear ribonucleoprotein 1 [Rosa chinensis]PRQ36724.1 putative DAZ-associated protein 1, RNA recognition motif 2 [Rosa chinensis]
MDSDQGKLFIGGISWETSEDKLKEYFSNYGDVLQTVVMRDKITQRPRGFGFVVFVDPAVLDRVLQEKHTIDGRTVEAKRALSREEQQTSVRSGNPNPGRNAGSGGNVRTKKIFVGGLPPTLTEEEFREYFEAYGHVTDVVVMYDQNTGRPRGFGFISFDTEDAVDRVLHKTFHDLSGKQVEVKRALPKDANPGGGGRSLGGGQGGGGASGGGYQGYGASGGNPNAYDGRIDSNRYMQSQSTGGGFPPYGSSGYSAPSYGYAPSSNGIGYGGYGGYGGTNTGYGGPAAAAYGNPNAPNAGYGGGPPGAPRSSWSSQAPSGYGGMGYGNTAPWGVQSGSAATGSGGPGSAPAGQSPSAAAGYGAQGYGYGGYGGGDASYGNPSAYGAVGGRSGSVPNNNVGGPGGEQGSGGGYIGSGYGDSNGNAGYGNSGWRADPSQASGNYGGQANGAHGGQVGYGGYSSAQARQAQQQ